jgi:hypothetical protein
MKKFEFGTQWVHAMRFQKFLGKNSRQQTRCSTNILTAYGQEGNILSTWCSTGEFLLHFIMVIITANHFLASFTDCHESQCNASGVSGGHLSVKQRKNTHAVFILFTFKHSYFKWLAEFLLKGNPIFYHVLFILEVLHVLEFHIQLEVVPTEV